MSMLLGRHRMGVWAWGEQDWRAMFVPFGLLHMYKFVVHSPTLLPTRTVNHSSPCERPCMPRGNIMVSLAPHYAPRDMHTVAE